MEPSFENGVYYTSGKKVLYYFSLTRILPIIIIFIILGVGSNFLEGLLNLKGVANISSVVLIALAIIFCVIAFLLAWVKYVSIKFMFDEFAFHIKKGFLSKSEIAIPYRQIQTINHSQSLNEKMLGIMNIIIQTAGEDDKNGSPDSQGVLPVLDAKIALAVEQELLKRSNVNANINTSNAKVL